MEALVPRSAVLVSVIFQEVVVVVLESKVMEG